MKSRKRSGKRSGLNEAHRRLRLHVERAVPTAAALLLMLAILITFQIMGPAMTGLIINEKTFAQGINRTLASAGTAELQIPLSLEAAPDSLKISGKVVGAGNARIYLQANGERYLVLDSSNIEESRQKPFLQITGKIVEELQQQLENITGATLIAELIDANATKSAGANNSTAAEEAANETLPSETPSEQQQPKTISIALEYQSGTAFDADDNGIETEEGAIDYTVAQTTFSWEADESRLCTRWKIDSLDSGMTTVTCNGAEKCCSLAELTPKEASWNEPFYLPYGSYDTGYNNTVSAQAIYANYNLETADSEVDVAYSEWEALQASFLKVTRFSNYCEETCSLPQLSLNETLNAKLIVEVENAEATIDSLTYTGKVTINTAPTASRIPTQQVKKNSAAVINLSAYFSDAEADTLSYEASSDNEGVIVSVVRNELLSIETRRGFTGNATITITASDSQLTAASRFIAAVSEEKANSPPKLLQSIPNITITGTAEKLNLGDYFTDEDGDELAYDASVFWTASINITGSTATVTADAEKSFAIITARDTQLAAASNRFNITQAQASGEKTAANISEKEEILTQGKAEINKPVKWRKTIRQQEESSTTTLIPAEAANITVTKNSQSIEDKVSVEKKLKSGRKIERLKQHKAISLATAATEEITEENITLIIEENATEVEVEYETPAPEVEETEISGSRKQILVSSELHYTNITAYTTLATEAPAAAVKLYWLRNGGREEVAEVAKQDTNNNSLTDRLEWTVPSLSNQTYEVQITILNVQSYPTVGGNWTVAFNTTGTANLTITAINGTSYTETPADNASTQDDLQFLELKCGDTITTPTKITDEANKTISIFSESWNCDNQTGYHTVKVLTPGKHTQQFNFSDQTAYAHNTATNDICDTGNDQGTCIINSTKRITNNSVLNFTELIIDQNGSLVNTTALAYFILNGTNLTIKDGGKILVSVNITVVNLSIETGGMINVTGTGHRGGKGGSGSDNTNGNGTGGGTRLATGKGGSGAGYGGKGGWSGNNTVVASDGGISYGNIASPYDPGSGGGGGGASSPSGGHGGGIIALNVSDTLSVTGSILAAGTNGGSDTNYPAGGGSGGSIHITTNTFTGNGTISANGETGGSGSYGAGGGGGGRITIYYQTRSHNGSITALSGAGTGTLGQKGTFGDNGSIYIINKTANLLRINLSVQALKKHSLNITEQVAGGTFTANIYNLNTTATRPVTMQLIKNYTGTLPAGSTATTPLFALNDTNTTVTNVTLTIPNTTAVNAIVHCLSWDYDTANCASWETKTFTEMNANTTSTNVIFNVSTFDAWGAGDPETTPPYIAYGLNSVANGSTVNVNWAFLNFTYTETNNHTFIIRNLSTNWTNVNATGSYFFYNFTNLNDGAYSFYGWINNTDGKANQTVNRTVTIDATPPSIDYGLNSAANGSTINVNWAFLNFTYTETNNHTFIIRNLSTNWTNVNATGSYFFYNFTNLNDGAYSFYGWINDTAANVNQTMNRTVTIDTTSPLANTSNNASTVTKRNGSVNWTVSFADNIALSSFTFGFNDSGSFVNDSAVTISGTAFLVNVTKTINATRGDNVCGIFYVSDTISNNNVSANSCFDVANTPPVFGADLTAQTATIDAVFNYTATCIDHDLETITYYGNSTLISLNATTGRINDTPSTSEIGSYIINISCQDADTNTSQTFTYTITDSAAPNITIILPASQANISGSFLINVSANDTSNVNTVNLTIHNNTGNATGQITTTRGSGTAAAGYWNATLNSAIFADGRYNISANATDAYGNVNTSQNTSIIIDNTKPNATIIGIANDSIQTTNFLINASVNDTTSKVFNATFRLANQTAATAWLYATLSSGSTTTGYWNATFDATTVTDGTYNITINATDYANNQIIANLTQVRIDKQPPTFSELANNASTVTGRYGSINWSIMVADTLELGNITFAFNDTGSFVFGSTLQISGTSFAYNTTRNLAASNKTHNVCGFFAFNDTALRQNTTANSCFNVANSAPIVTASSPATEYHNNANLTAEYTYMDIDADSGTCYLITNSTINATNSSIANGTTTNITSNLTLDGNYTWHISCSDGTATTNTTTRTFILDTANPIITWTSPANDNTSISKQNLSMNVQCADTNLFRMLVNVTNSTHQTFSKLYDSINSTTQIDNSLVNFTTNGTYTAEVSCTDDHTKGSIEGYGYAVSEDLLEFKANTTRTVPQTGIAKALATRLGRPQQEVITEENIFTATLRYENSAGKLLPIAASQNLATAIEKKTDRYKWAYSLALPSKDFVAVVNISSGKPIHYRTPSSGIPGHFVVEGYYIDFQDVVNEGFNVSVEKAGSSYLVKIWKDSYPENVGDTLIIDPVSGGLNTVTEFRSYLYNSIGPTFTALNTNATASTRRNDSANWTVTLSDDINLSQYIFSINDTGAFVNNSRVLISGQSYVASASKQQNATKGKQVCARFHFNDTADNQNTTTDSCFTVANTPPAFAETIGTKTANADSEFTYNVQCADMDIETITYYDNSTLFNISSATGLINDTPIDAEAGTHTINISCQDSEANTSQTFTYRITDSANPTYYNLSNNASTVTARNGSINWTANISDNLALDSFIFGFNDTGSFINDSATTMSGTSFLINVTKTKINSTRGKSVCGAFYFNDTSGNNNNTAYSCFNVANTPPAFGADLTAQTALTNQTFAYSIACIEHDLESITHYDNTTLFNINEGTGAIADSPSESDVGSYVINISCQDASANTSQTFTYTVSDATTPTFSSLANNASTATARNGSINWTVTFADGFGLGNFTFEFNDTGNFAKDSNTIISGTSFTVNVTKTKINSTRSKNICGRFIANDTSLNQNTSSLSCFSIANSAPPAPTITPSSLTNYTGSASLTCSGIDHDFDTLTYEFYADTSSTPTTLRQNTTGTAYTYTTTTSGSHYFRCRAHDATDAGSYTAATELYFDIEAPVFNTTTNNASNSKFNDSITFGINILDNMGLSFARFSHNMSGSFVNQSLAAVSGRNYTFNTTLIVNVPKNTKICGMFWANDTLNTPNTSTQSCFTTANIAPRFNPALADQTASSGQAFTYDVDCTDDDSDAITYSDNTALFNINSGTGAIADTPAESDVGAYSITITCGDGTANTQATFTYTVLDATAPAYGNLTNNGSTNTLQNSTVNWSINMHDGNELGSYIFSFNDTGSFVNDTPLTIGGQSYFANVTKTITATEGASVCARFFINDSANNQISTTNSCFTVAASTDTTLPTYSSLANNASTTSKQNASVNWSIILADNSALSSYTFGFNGSGIFVNDTTQSISGTSWAVNITKNINSSKNSYVCGAFHFNDTTGNTNNTAYSCYTVANTAPQFSPALADQTAGSGQTFTYDVNCTDIDSDTITYSDNTALFNINSGTGAITHTPAESDTGSYSVTITCGDGTANTQSTFTYTINDGVTPTYTGFANNASTVTLQNGAVNWSATLADGVALSAYTFSFNDSGSFVNDTAATISGTSRFVNVTKTITAAPNSKVCARFHFNDTADNQNTTSDSCFTVKQPATNNIPSTPTIIFPANNSYVNQQAVQLNASSSDADNESITYYHIINGTLNQTSTDANATFTATDAFYTYKVYASDGVNASANSTEVVFTKDTAIPLVNFSGGTAANATNLSRNWIFINVSVVELNEANITFRIYNSTDVVSSQTFTDRTRSKNFTGLSSGTYFYNVTVDDLAGSRNTTQTRQIRLDTSAPLLSNITAISVTNSSAVVEWNTNENANSSLSYGLTTNYSVVIENNTNSTTHFISIGSLNESAAYHYKISSTDVLGNTNTSGDLTFATLTIKRFTTTFTANVTQTINTSEARVNTVISITTGTGISSAPINVSGGTETPTNKTLNVTALKYIEIRVPDALYSAVTSVILKVFYNETEITGKNMSESSLGMYRYNDSKANWERLNTSMGMVLDTGVNTTDNYVFANITNFSSYGIGGRLANGASCTASSQCDSSNCATGFDGNNYCAVAGGCANAGVSYANAGTACDGSNLQTCSSGSWTSSTCTWGCENAACKSAPSGSTDSGGAGGGGGGGGGAAKKDIDSLKEDIEKISKAITGVIVDTKELMREMHPGETATAIINLKNSRKENVKLEISIDGDVSRFVYAQREILIPAEGSEQLTVSIVIPDNARTKAYTGEITLASDKDTMKIPVTLKVSERLKGEKLLDLKVEPLERVLAPGSELNIQSTVYNLGSVKRIDVQIIIEVVNPRTNETISRQEKALEVETSASSIDQVKLPEELQPGRYTIIGTAYYTENGIRNEAKSVSEIEVRTPLFEILKPYLFKKYRFITGWQLLIIATLLPISAYAYLKYRKISRQRRRYNVLVDFGKLPKPGNRSAFIGKIAETGKAAYIEMDKLQTHSIVAGATGSGKTVAAQGIVEEALQKNIAVIVFDPTAQWSGFLRKCADRRMLDKYSEFGLRSKNAKAFPGNVRQVTDPLEVIDIKRFIEPGRINIFAINRLEPKEIDTFIANTIREVFKANFEESQDLKLLLVYDEVHRLLTKFGGSGEGLVQLERAARECRKWGIGLALISQVLTDFVGEIKANIATQIQMRTSDEGDLERIRTKYGDEFVKSIVKAAVGTGMLENSEYNKGRAYFISFRPLLHSTTRLPDSELEQYNKFNEALDELESQTSQLKDLNVDVFDIEIELKLAKEKLGTGNFNMVQVYLESLEPKISATWKKLNKTPKKLEKKRVSTSELKAEVTKARIERKKIEGKEEKPKLDSRIFSKKLKKGSLFIVREKGADASFKLLSSNLKQYKQGLCFTRQEKAAVAKKYGLSNTRIETITTEAAENAYSPTSVSEIYKEIKEFATKNKTGAVLIDGLVLIINYAGFEQAYNLLQRIKDTINDKEIICIIPLNTEILNREQAKKLEEFTTIEGWKK